MKKVLMFAVSAFFATASFAQDVVKEVNSCKNYKNAVELISTKGLNGVSSEDKAKAYNKVVDLALNKMADEDIIRQTNTITGANEPFDTLGFYDASIEGIKASLLCDKFDNEPNEKGKIKPRFHKKNQERLLPILPNLINAGGIAYGSRDNVKAMDCFELFLEASKAPLFVEKFVEGNENYAMAAYYAAFISYGNKDFAKVAKYIDIAMDHPKFQKDAVELKIYSLKEQLKTPEDSTRFIGEIKALHQKYPEDQRYFSMIVEFYGSKESYKSELQNFLSSEIAARPNDPIVWAVKGEYEMNSMAWDEAVASYKKALEIKADFVPVIYNLGVCLNSKAGAMKEQLSDSMGRMTPENEAAVLKVLGEARDYMLQAKQMDPDRTAVNWAYPLYQIYYAMGDEAGMKEMEKYVQ